MKISEVIDVDPERMSGVPCFAGARVPVTHLFDYLEAGDSLGEFLNDFPTVTREQALSLLELMRERLLTGYETAASLECVGLPPLCYIDTAPDSLTKAVAGHRTPKRPRNARGPRELHSGKHLLSAAGSVTRNESNLQGIFAIKTSSIRKGRRQPVAGSNWRRLSVQIG